MKNHIKIFIVMLSIAFISCLEAKDDKNKQMLGVWEFKEINVDEKRTFKLVFGKDNIGMHLNRVEHVAGEITSSARLFEWRKKNDVIEIEKKDLYQLNSTGQLVSNESEDSVFVKVSDDYSKYLGDK